MESKLVSAPMEVEGTDLVIPRVKRSTLEELSVTAAPMEHPQDEVDFKLIRALLVLCLA